MLCKRGRPASACHSSCTSNSSKIGTFDVVISNCTPDDTSAIDLRRHLQCTHGYTVFQQQTDRFAKDSCDWKREWMPNAQAAALIVCLVSPDYLKSEACSAEFRVAEEYKKLMVVCLCPPDIVAFKNAIRATDTRATPSAAGPVMYVTGGGQLTACDKGLEVVAAEVAKVLQNRRLFPMTAAAAAVAAAETEASHGTPRPGKKDESQNEATRYTSGGATGVHQRGDMVHAHHDISSGVSGGAEDDSEEEEDDVFYTVVVQEEEVEEEEEEAQNRNEHEYTNIYVNEDGECSLSEDEEEADAKDEEGALPRLTAIVDQSFEAELEAVPEDVEDEVEAEVEAEHEPEAQAEATATAPAPAPALTPLATPPTRGNGFSEGCVRVVVTPPSNPMLKCKRCGVMLPPDMDVIDTHSAKCGVVLAGGTYTKTGASIADAMAAPATSPRVSAAGGGGAYWGNNILFGTVGDAISAIEHFENRAKRRRMNPFLWSNDDDELFVWAKNNRNATSTGDMLCGKNITDLGLRGLCSLCTNLAEVNLARTQITDAGVERLAASCSKVTTLNISNCPQLTDVGVTALAAYSRNLTKVYLDGTQVSDDAAKALSLTCECLIWVSLSNTGVSKGAQKCMKVARPNLMVYAPPMTMRNVS